MAEINTDGLRVRYFGDQATKATAGYHDIANLRSVVMEISSETDYAPATVCGNTDCMYLKTGAVIHSAFLKVVETFTAAGAATLTIGTHDVDATAIDADGIDAAIALAALTKGNVVKCDGAQVAAETATGTYLQKDGWITTTVGTGPFTAGKAFLTVYFVEDTVTNGVY